MKQHTSGTRAEQRDPVEQEAERVRSRLIGDLDELKARGRGVGERLKNLQASLRRHPGLLVGAGAVSLVGLGLLLRARRTRRLRDERRDLILGVAARLLGPMYVVERKDQRPSVVKNTFKQASRAVLATAARELGRRALLAVAAQVAEPEAAVNGGST